VGMDIHKAEVGQQVIGPAPFGIAAFGSKAGRGRGRGVAAAGRQPPFGGMIGMTGAAQLSKVIDAPRAIRRFPQFLHRGNGQCHNNRGHGRDYYQFANSHRQYLDRSEYAVAAIDRRLTFFLKSAEPASSKFERIKKWGEPAPRRRGSPRCHFTGTNFTQTGEPTFTEFGVSLARPEWLSISKTPTL
jgi:hypothetical protein